LFGFRAAIIGLRKPAKKSTVRLSDDHTALRYICIDGSKFRAVNSPKRNFTEKKLRRMIREIDGKINQYLKDLDRQDKEEAGQ
jgi:hypothetical protein